MENLYASFPFPRVTMICPLPLSTPASLIYAAYANDRENGTRVAPTFADAVKMHRLLDLISAASSTGTRQTVNFRRSSG
jgi:predicted dehydrogenase